MNAKPERRQVFEWNWGAWFGTQIGCTIWILICALILLSKDFYVGGIAFALFLTPNLVGTALWIARHKIKAYPAIQMLLAVCWISSLASIYVIEASGLWSAVSGAKVNGFGGDVSAGSMKFLIVLMFPAMMLFFHLMQRGSRS